MPFSINKKYFWQIANSASGASIGFAFLWLLRRFAGVFYPDFCRKNTLNAPDFKEAKQMPGLNHDIWWAGLHSFIIQAKTGIPLSQAD
jgi:hypothetical protein